MVSDTVTVAAIVPAAGAGARLGGSVHKPFIPLAGQPLVLHALRVLQDIPAIRWVILVVREGEQATAAALMKEFGMTKALAPCVGGGSRAESVARGFAAVPADAAWVLIHDAARPCVSGALIERTIRAAKRTGAAACGLPASVTVKAVDDERQVRLTLDREHLWFVETPQVFRRDWFAQALSRADGRLDQFPDDAALVESAGFPVRMVEGEPLNLKVTTKNDLLLAEAILAARATWQVKTQKAKVKTTRQNSKVGTERFAVGGHF